MKIGYLRLGFGRSKRLEHRLSPRPKREMPHRSSPATSIPLELLNDIFLCLDRNEVEKCQLVCRHYNYFIEDNGLSLAYRLLDLLELNDDGSIRTPSIMHGIELEDVSKVLKLCYVKRCRTDYFNERIYRTMRHLKESMEKPVTVGKLKIGYINDHRDFTYCFQLLDVAVKELIKAEEAHLIFCSYQLGYLVSRPDLLHIPLPTSVTFCVDNGQSIYDSDVPALLNYLFNLKNDHSMSKGAFMMDSLNVGIDFVDRVCQRFLAHPNPSSLWKFVMVLPRSSTIVHGKRYLKQHRYKKYEGKIKTGYINLEDYVHPYIIERSDGWCLLVGLRSNPAAMVEGEEYEMAFFVREKSQLYGSKKIM